jgi:hypothetical protein
MHEKRPGQEPREWASQWDTATVHITESSKLVARPLHCQLQDWAWGPDLVPGRVFIFRLKWEGVISILSKKYCRMSAKDLKKKYSSRRNG